MILSLGESVFDFEPFLSNLIILMISCTSTIQANKSNQNVTKRKGRCERVEAKCGRVELGDSSNVIAKV